MSLHIRKWLSSQFRLQHLRFRPHGNNLLTPSAAFWLASVRVMVFAMALAEGISWGYLGHLFGDGEAYYIGAAVGATIFVVIWMIDLSLVTLDRAWAEHSQKLLGRNVDSQRRRAFRDGFTFLLRITLLAASLTITAPYLAQVVFYDDIRQLISKEAVQNLDEGRKSLLKKYEVELAAKNREVAEKRKEYEAETAGRGLSGRYGEGSAASALRKAVESLVVERGQLEKRKDEALRAFGELSRNWEASRDRLASDYNITLPKPSVLQNRKALEELRTRPENIQTELAIKTFLVLIFGGLLLLKLFEPASVRLYMSDVLQQEYLSYLAGLFDDALPPAEKSTNPRAQISPQRFYSFLVNSWIPQQRNSDELRVEARRKREIEETAREKDRLREEQRKEWQFAEEQRKVAEERARQEHQQQWTLKQRAREEERWDTQQQLEEAIDVSQKRIQAAKTALGHLQEQRDIAVKEEEGDHKAFVDQRKISNDFVYSCIDLEETIKVVERDISFFDRELRSYEEGSKTLDERGRATFATIQAEIREKRNDAQASLVNLKENLIVERTKKEDALHDLAEADAKYKKSTARILQIQAKIEQLEDQISKEALSLGSVILAPKDPRKDFQSTTGGDYVRESSPESAFPTDLGEARGEPDDPAQEREPSLKRQDKSASAS